MRFVLVAKNHRLRPLAAVRKICLCPDKTVCFEVLDGQPAGNRGSESPPTRNKNEAKDICMGRAQRSGGGSSNKRIRARLRTIYPYSSGLARDEQASTRLLPPSIKCRAPRLEIVALPVVLNDGADRVLLVASYGGEPEIGEAIGYGWFHGYQSIRVNARNVFTTTAIAATVTPARHNFPKDWTDRLSVRYKKR